MRKTLSTIFAVCCLLFTLLASTSTSPAFAKPLSAAIPSDTFASINCIEGGDIPAFQIKGWGVGYTGGQKISISLTVYDTGGTVIVGDGTTLYTSNTGSWSTSTYTHYGFQGAWSVTVTVRDANNGFLIDSASDTCR
ncbi:hypothetical protein [Amycolatopsis vastitatis]|uniref:hypothetical protein n=1 Tax=Amycolatopsis vastitatis TaxID=1905142 RepID=UPI001177E67E|nr:hypothetical protein [Amycolatopsis vastitatis]